MHRESGTREQTSSIRMIRAGILTTVQDLGRHGSRHLGVAQAGALDRYSLMLANKLLGNSIDSAGLEILVGPVEIEFERDTWFVLCGANFAAHLDHISISKAWRHFARAGQRLILQGAQKEARCYLAVDGGICVGLVLGSRSTDLQAQFGGFDGRALKKGDRLPIGSPRNLRSRVGVQQRMWTPEVRAIRGPEFTQFDLPTQKRFWQQAWQVTSQSNRMGFRLQGETLERGGHSQLLSHAVLPGVIQVPPNGQPIVLLADCQTTGGYPRIATVIEADLWKVAQTPIGGHFCFIEVDHDAAKIASKKWQRELNRLDGVIHA
ncbi:biotin-dependent carboxyltransferase family protein [Undibacterium fentianense]|uniref:Biotin-dependent carboxyltransferase family protein n=1 Tax=Undibacterium fentianense TaxID=2828728 RepID=A0A941DY76_9BURK|nr:biotin-dependent carboxyltransferase family protein [Undibacterium fentianense]MBR7799629.1 biotin-dependent carboxyltransferase family protein [Undibacterium fentianense]